MVASFAFWISLNAFLGGFPQEGFDSCATNACVNTRIKQKMVYFNILDVFMVILYNVKNA